MTFYNLELEEIYQRLHTNPEKGLTEKEFKNRLETDGYNELPKYKPKFWRVYLAPLFNWLIVIYLIGALILLIAGKIQIEEETSSTLLYTTLSVVALNCIIAVIQQYRATKKLEALAKLSAPTANVIRDSKLRKIPANEIVVGDIIKIEQGDRVPADCRVIRTTNLEVDESALTGESDSVSKSDQSIRENAITLPLQKNMVFLGTYVTLGNALAVVVRTGLYNEIGKISRGLKSTNTREIPIQKKMNNFGKWLGIAVLVFWILSFIFIWISTGRANIFKSLNSAMDIMPINIPLLSTIVLITGVLTMATRGVIIRNLTSVDSLGRISVLCVDKTGTITEGKMLVQYVLSPSSLFKVSGSGYNPIGTITLENKSKKSQDISSLDAFPELKSIINASNLSSNAQLVKKEQIIRKNTYEHWDVNGSPTEGALIALYQKSRRFVSKIDQKKHDFVDEYPFDSVIKMMSKLLKIGSEYVLFTKGAPEKIIELSITIQKDSTVIPFTNRMKNTILEQINEFSSKGYRILSIAQKNLGDAPPNRIRENLECNLIYLGSVIIMDSPRQGVNKSIQSCREAGIDVKMITGDSLLTANAIANEIGLIDQDQSEIPNTTVYARITPSDKNKIVTQFQNNSHIVAMTGDGVNDALALSTADVGIAMGLRGTDIAKEASDMVIANDSFNTIVDGISEGRGIFTRIRAIVFFYIAINVFEGLVQFILTIVLDLPYFLNEDFYLQWIFLAITLHTIPGLILTFDITNKDVMKEKPRNSEEILTKPIIYLMVSYGILLAMSMCLVYFVCITGTYPVFPFNSASEYFPYYGESLELQKQGKTLTMLMVVLYFCESLLIFQIRSMNKSTVKSLKEDTRHWMFILIVVLFGIFLSLMYIPGFQNILAGLNIGDIAFNFRFMRLSGWDWILCALIAFICIGGFELVKYIFRKRGIMA